MGMPHGHDKIKGCTSSWLHDLLVLNNATKRLLFSWMKIKEVLENTHFYKTFVGKTWGQEVYITSSYNKGLNSTLTIECCSNA